MSDSGMHDTIFAPIFEALTRAMGVANVTETSPTQRSRVVWEIVGDPVWGPAPFKRRGEKTIGRYAWPHLATIYADSSRGAQELLAQFTGHLDRIAGPPQGDVSKEISGYEIKPGKLQGIAGGDGKAAGYACEVAVTLYQVVASEIRPSATLKEIAITVAPDAPEALTAGTVSATAA